MAKPKTQYVCRECGAAHSKWGGQCSDCGEWNTLDEITLESSAKTSRFRGYTGEHAKVQNLSQISHTDEARFATGMEEMDRVLGGGLVPGSVVLIGGDPGVGKSTLLLQNLCDVSQNKSVLYVTGEESPRQISLRGNRLDLNVDNLRLLAETSVERITNIAQKEKPALMVVDSIQTIHTEQLQSAPGGVAQVRESAAQLVRFAKQTGTTVILVGHVTKEGALAGPRVLEHMVDAVLYFEGQSDSRYRVIRAVKNRFGAVNELGVFAMTDAGLKQIRNPSAIFLAGYGDPVPGSVVTATWEGSRPLLVEVQALVDDSSLGNPRRVTVGLDQTRLAMLLAVLSRHGGISTHGQDVFLNVVGGVRVMETGADLPILAAVLSSLRNRSIDRDWLIFGELGLGGEIRPVPNGQERLAEAVKHGFKKAIVPQGNAPKNAIKGIEVRTVKHISEALDSLF
ncbi:MAG: DNA repair protein RadA [Gammaproteobacteria bacterium]|nr:DNA repair protein RadA [Gammaproteobacteria bacterium]NNJ73157.1 DNA repair protein RadA [Enterobacterales bacterium]